jgi:hypothetical protein
MNERRSTVRADGLKTARAFMAGSAITQARGGLMSTKPTLEQRVTELERRLHAEPPGQALERIYQTIKAFNRAGRRGPDVFLGPEGWRAAEDAIDELQRLARAFPGLYRRTIARLKAARARLRDCPDDTNGLLELDVVENNLKGAIR